MPAANCSVAPVPSEQTYVQRDQPPGVAPLELTGERTLPDVPEENYWFRRHLAVYEWIAERVSGLDAVAMACRECYCADVLGRRARAVLGVDATLQAHAPARRADRRVLLALHAGDLGAGLRAAPRRPASTSACAGLRRGLPSVTPPRGRQGELALVLHTHMPYVEGFGTWPFGEEWLFEAMATSYLPILDVLEGGAPITLSLTPVLCDQLQAPGVAGRFAAFLRGVRRESHRLDAEAARRAGDEAVAAAVEHSAARYEEALERFERIDGDLMAALAPYAAWTSAATHAVLPLLATDAGVRLQVRSGIQAHRRRTGGWAGGFWLPECAHAPELDGLLAGEGVVSTCVDLTGVIENPLRPLRSDAGVLLAPLDRATVELVWSPGGYPSRAPYRDSWRKTEHEHRAWAIDGAVYDPQRALEQARADAADFAARVAERLRGGGLCVCALDTELLGHWWHEGAAWLRFAVDALAGAGVPLVGLDDALARQAPAAA